MDIFDSMDDRIERLLERAYAEAERARKEIDAAHAAGKEIIQVLCDPTTKRGDIIDITQAELEEDEEVEAKKVRVVACQEISGMHPETFEVHHVNYAWCIVLNESDITTEEDFAALYADGEPVEAEAEAVGAEAVDPNICSCGANREMCERNQNVFGGHLE